MVVGFEPKECLVECATVCIKSVIIMQNIRDTVDAVFTPSVQIGCWVFDMFLLILIK